MPNIMSPNFAGDLAALRQQGEDSRYQKKQRNAFATAGGMAAQGDYGGAAGALMGSGNIQAGMGLKGYADQQTAQQAVADKERKAQAAGTVAQMLVGLQDVPPEQRAQVFAQQASMLGQFTDTPEQVDQMAQQALQNPNAFTDQEIQATLQALQAGGFYTPPERPGVHKVVQDAQGNYVSILDDASTAQSGVQGVDPNAMTPYQEAQLGLNREKFEFSKTNPKGPQTVINNNPFGGGTSSLSDIPIGQVVPPKMLQGVKIPEDHVPVRAENSVGFEFVPVPGSPAALKAARGDVAAEGREFGLGSLVRSYTTLKNNNAITSNRNNAGENLGALYSGTGLGKFQDAVGGNVGNNENITARNTIQGLSMKALMDMISMSDVSAKAMDSDAEMKAWLGAIRDDNYEAAMTKLHALDVSFNDGKLMQEMYAAGEIDLPTYQFVTNRVQNDPQTVAMMNRMNQFKALEGAVGRDNLTDGETAEMDELLQFMSPEERALFGDQ